MTRLLVLGLVLLGALDGISLIRNAPRKTTLVVNAAGSCNACRMHEDIRALSLQAIKEQILSKLGLKQAPNMTGRPLPKIPPISRLLDIYEIQADQPLEQIEPGLTRHEEIDEYAAKTENVISLAQPHPRLRHSKGNLDVLYFKFSDKIVQHRVTEAKLSLWVWGSDHESGGSGGVGVGGGGGGGSGSDISRTSSVANFQQQQQDDNGKIPLTITLQRILKGSTDNGGPILGPQLTTKHPRPDRIGDWILIDVKRMVTQWFKHPRENLGVVIKVSGSNSHRRNNNFKLIELDPDAEHTPYLDVEIEDPEARRGGRVKRTVGLNCDEASQESRCCRYKLTVDFEKFGWDWIIAPKRYDANYCSGDCPMAFLPEYPNTHIVSLAEPPNNSGPCCAARKLSQISMLYFDSEYQIVFTKIPGMVVERCGCY